MGFLGNLIRKNLIKQTSRTIFSAYLKIKNENPDLSEKDILESLIASRKPYWEYRSTLVLFKGHLAFTSSFFNDIGIGSLIEMINIWELIIINPNDTKDQNITICELQDMIKDVVDITFEIRDVIPASEKHSVKDSAIETWMGYACETIGRLGGKIYQV